MTLKILRAFITCVKAVGLLGNSKGLQSQFRLLRILVPPEHLADYIVEFRALLDSHNLNYGMFGHVDAGYYMSVLLDMCDPQQEVLMKQISDEIVALTAKYGGLFVGEHGKVSVRNIVLNFWRCIIR